MDLKRLWTNITTLPHTARRCFPPDALERITAAITASETKHDGEVRFVVEAALDPLEVLSGKSARAKAIELFSELRIWDTERNSGVLIYLLLSEHDIEIVADRGISARVDQSEWSTIRHEMEERFRRGEFEQGVLRGIEHVTVLLERYFPRSSEDRNELPDRATIL